MTKNYWEYTFRVKHFKHLLEGNDFVIYTDHKPLNFAFKQKNEKASPRQQRQLQYISEFSCNIQHVLGKDNIVADALSRIDSISEINFEEIAEEQTTDEELQQLLLNNSLKFKPSTLPSGKKLWCNTSTQKIRPYIMSGQILKSKSENGQKLALDAKNVKKVESLHRTLKGAIKAHNNIRWTESLPTVLLGLRAAIRPDISYTIAQMVYGTSIKLPGREKSPEWRELEESPKGRRTDIGVERKKKR
ncbi:transposon Ty3-I Gag-Pol polyprotein [Trichonephila clavipes]|nr:transposon Ty3-I Gag-Pol polyprotein [Trichonephila clavipes]